LPLPVKEYEKETTFDPILNMGREILLAQNAAKAKEVKKTTVSP
jgi:hypothetical protein